MVQLLPQQLTISEFIEHYGDNDCYELIDGELIEMEPTGPHEQVAAFIGRKLNVAIDNNNEDFLIPYRCLVKVLYQIRFT
ncbi:MAG: hypothetical protein F6K47_39580 [Symploca sp. SIO2E6]|nr:hypothetical protein [Symploca sp. SIO2E6]